MPERVCRFVASDWPDAACPHHALRMWVDACTAWLAEDSDDPPGSRDLSPEHLVMRRSAFSRRSLPFGVYGDSIDVLRAWGEYRHLMPPCAAEQRRWDGPDATGRVQYDGSCEM